MLLPLHSMPCLGDWEPNEHHCLTIQGNGASPTYCNMLRCCMQGCLAQIQTSLCFWARHVCAVSIYPAKGEAHLATPFMCGISAHHSCQFPVGLCRTKVAQLREDISEASSGAERVSSTDRDSEAGAEFRTPARQSAQCGRHT